MGNLNTKRPINSAIAILKALCHGNTVKGIDYRIFRRLSLAQVNNNKKGIVLVISKKSR